MVGTEFADSDGLAAHRLDRRRRAGRRHPGDRSVRAAARHARTGDARTDDTRTGDARRWAGRLGHRHRRGGGTARGRAPRRWRIGAGVGPERAIPTAPILADPVWQDPAARAAPEVQHRRGGPCAARRRTRSERRLRWLIPVGVLATVLPLAHSASAGVPTGGSATAQPAHRRLDLRPSVRIELGRPRPLRSTVGPTAGEQTVPGTLDVTYAGSAPHSSPTSTSVFRQPAPSPRSRRAPRRWLAADPERHGADATRSFTYADCPAATSSAVLAEAQTSGLALGDAAPVDLSVWPVSRAESIPSTDEAAPSSILVLTSVAILLLLSAPSSSIEIVLSAHVHLSTTSSSSTFSIGDRSDSTLPHYTLGSSYNLLVILVS